MGSARAEQKRDARREKPGWEELVRDRTNLPFFFADPKLVERAEAGEDASPEPPAVPPLRCIPRCVDLDLFSFV